MIIKKWQKETEQQQQKLHIPSSGVESLRVPLVLASS